MIGNINSIETMGLVDGPGIRFVVFMQGCPLRCKYCHNPETWKLNDDSNKYTANDLIKKILNYFIPVSKKSLIVVRRTSASLLFTASFKADISPSKYNLFLLLVTPVYINF